MVKRIFFFFALIIFVLVFSNITYRFFGNPEENNTERKDIIITGRMSISEYGRVNRIPLEALLNIFNLKQVSDTVQFISSSAYSIKEMQKRTLVFVSEFNEEHSKNPLRYTIHFILGMLFMSALFYFLRKSQITPGIRRYLYLFSILVFGLGFNSSPSPMGPLKDTISLVDNLPEIIHPRLFAILTYLIIGIIANKFICSWVCQLGVLQDFLFRLNRNKKDNKALVRQFKIPFAVSNSIRIVFFFATVVSSYILAVNIIDSVNPFAVFSGLTLKAGGWFFIGSILVISILVYRPWCSLFCPFGLLSWICENLSIYKIRVNQKTCTSCNACVSACPSDAMSAILAKKKVKPDCFSCGSCISECPENSVTYSRFQVNSP